MASHQAKEVQQQVHTQHHAQHPSETHREGVSSTAESHMNLNVGQKFFCLLMSVILVIGLFPGLNYSTAYAAEGDNDTDANEDTPALVNGDGSGDATQASDDIGDGADVVTAAAGGVQPLATKTVGNYAVYTTDSRLIFYYGYEAEKGDTSITTLNNNRTTERTIDDVTVSEVYGDLGSTDFKAGSDAPWSAHATTIMSVVMDESLSDDTSWGDKFKPTSTAYWFDGFTACTTMDLKYLDTILIESMEGMFKGCSSLSSLTLPAAYVNTKTTNLTSMFYNCSSLETLDMSAWDTKEVTACDDFLVGAEALKSVTIGNNVDIFSRFGSSTLGTPGITSFGTWFKADRTNIPENGISGAGKYYTSESTAFAIYCETDSSLTFYFDEVPVPEAGTEYNGKTVTAVFTGFDETTYTGWSNVPWYNYRTSITNVTTDESFYDATPIATDYWFYGFTACTSMDLTYLNTSSVTGMYCMFDDCTSLTSLVGLDTWDTSSVTNMHAMFEHCSSLESLDLSSWDTSAVTLMYNMFYGCTNLKTVDVSGWNTAAVTDVSDMFYECSSLEYLDLSSWDTSSVTSGQNRGGFLTNATSLKYIIIGANCNLFSESTSALVSIQNWFLADGTSASTNYLIGATGLNTYYASDNEDKYTITTAANPEAGGTVTASIGDTAVESGTTEVLPGQTITVTIGTNTGYALTSVTVTYTIDGSEETLTITPEEGSDTCSFTMPMANVTVTAEFEESHSVTVSNEIANGAVTIASVNGNSLNEGTTETTAFEGDVIAGTVTPAEGYKLKEGSLAYYTNDSEQTTSITDSNGVYSFAMPDASVTIVAEFEEIIYHITTQVVSPYTTEEAGSIEITSVDDSTPVKDDVGVIADYNNIVEFTINVVDGYELESVVINGGDVTVNPNGDNYMFRMPDGNAEIVVTFTAKSYNIYGSTDYNGTLTFTVGESTDAAYRAPYGSTVTITPEGNPGYVINPESIKILKASDDSDVTDEVNYSSDGGTYTFTMPAYSVIVKAEFMLIPYYITINSQIAGGSITDVTINGDAGTLTDDKYSANYGDEVTFVPTPDTGYQLVSGSVKVTYADDETQEVPCNYNNGTYTFDMPEADVVITAEFEAVTYRIIPSTDRNGMITVSPSSANYGNTITFTPEGYTGYELVADSVAVMDITGTIDMSDDVGLKESETTPGTWTFTMPAVDVMVVASFKAIDYTIENITNPDSGGTIEVKYVDDEEPKIDPDTGLPTANYNQIVSITVTANAGYDLNTEEPITYTYTDENGDEQTGIASYNNGGYSFQMPASNVTIEGHFIARTYNLLGETHEHGTIEFYGSYDESTGTFSDSITSAATDSVVYIAITEVATGYELTEGGITITYVDDEGETHTYGKNDDGSDNESQTITPVTDAQGNVVGYTFTMPAGVTTVAPEFTQVNYEVGKNITANLVDVSDIAYELTLTGGTHEYDFGGTVGTADASYYETVVTFTLDVGTGYKLDGVVTVTTAASGYTETVEVHESDSGYWFIMPADAVQITAKIVPDDFSIYTEDDGHGTVKTSPAGSATYGAEVTGTATANPGYELAKVLVNDEEVNFTDGTEAGTYDFTFTMPSKDATVSVTFSQIDYTISTDATGTKINQSDTLGTFNVSGTHDDGQGTQVANIGDNISFTVVAGDGYQLVEDSVKVTYVDINGTEQVVASDDVHRNGAAYTFEMPAGNVTITAEFEAAAFSIYHEDDGHGTVTTTPTDSAVYGSDVAVSYEANPGYKLEKITYTDVNGDEVEVVDNTFKMPASNTTVKITFSAIDYTVTANPTGDPVNTGDVVGTIEMTLDGQISTTEITGANIGDNISFTVTPGVGYQLTDGSIVVTYVDDNGAPYTIDSADVHHNGDSYTFEMPAGNVTITAAFEPATFTIYNESGDNGTNTTATSAKYGDSVQVTYTADDGYEIVTVTKTINGLETEIPYDQTEGGYFFDMPASDVTINVTFKATDYTVTLDNESTKDLGSIEISDGTTKDAQGNDVAHIGDTVTIKGTANSISYELTDVSVLVYDESGTLIEVMDGIY